LIQTPIVLHALGPERFGIWIAVIGVVWTLPSFDAGIGFALQNRIALALAAGSEADAAALVRKGFKWLTLLATLVAIAAAPLLFARRAPEFLGVHDADLAAETRSALQVAYLAVIASFPLSLASRTAAACQAMWLTGFWTMIASIIGLAATMMSAWLGLSLAAFTASACILPLLPQLGTAVHLAARSPWLRNRAATIELRFAAVWRESALFFIPQIGAAFISSFVPTLVSHFSGPVVAGGFGVLQRVFGLVTQVQGLSLQPTWPAYTHAMSHGDTATARRLYRRSWVLTLVIIVGIGAIIPFWRPLLHVWLRTELPSVSTALVGAVGAWHCLQCLGQPPAMLLNGTGRIEPVARIAAVTLIFSVILCFPLGRLGGAFGVLAALSIPYVTINLPFIIVKARRVLEVFSPTLP
jgi:O-antigen/teichoic acid export membrane protein